MKLLIVDDEKLTREGLLKEVDFNALGIDSIETAEDGLSGLKLCKSFEPDIVLTDVRMPKMDGIRMMEAVQERYPDCAVIFMSGYSDKEYLKAAIKLHAVSYVEKPIDTDELTEAVKEALSQVLSRRSAQRSLNATRRSADFTVAYRLIKSPDKDDLRELVEEGALSVDIKNAGSCFAMIINDHDPYASFSEEETERFAELIRPVADRYRLQMLCTVNSSLYVFLLFSGRALTEKQSGYFAGEITECLGKSMESFHVVLGRQVKGYGELSHSYNTAVINLQQSFFMPDNTFLLYSHIPGKTVFKSINNADSFSEFKKLISDHRKEGALSYLDKLLKSLTGSDYILPNQAREFYYRLLSILIEAGNEKKLTKDKYLPANDLWERISACHSVFELNDLMTESTGLFFTVLDASKTESSVVYSIKNYISENYGDMDLSIMAISEHVHLSGSYVCTLFKSETGITLNQYITEYRLMRAKDLLSDPRNRIGEIAGRVGYSDSNYFSKIFRKSFGLSPSEFRESL